MKSISVLALTLGLGSVVYAQDVIAAKAGLIHYTEGDVTVGGKAVANKSGDFAEMQKGDELRTALGRAEILLGPGVFLRVSENSGFRLISSAIEDTRLELTAGSVLIEAAEFQKKHHSIVVKVGDTEVEIQKQGLYRFDADPSLLQVYEGAATVVAGGQPITVKEGRQTALSAVPNPEKFNTDRGDAFYRWAARRSSYIALANITAAKRLQDSGTMWSMGNWMYNPYFGLFTYIPYSGMYRSPFGGWGFYSPRAVQSVYYRPPARIYNPPPSMGGGFGGGQRSYSDFGGRSSMGSYSAGGHAAPPPAAAAPAPAASGRGDGGGGGRSGGGGR